MGKLVVDISKLYEIFDEIYIFEKGDVTRMEAEKVTRKYICSDLYCSCPFDSSRGNDCRHQKMIAGTFVGTGASKDVASEVMKELTAILEQDVIPDPPEGVEAVTIESKVVTDMLIVGVRKDFVVYIK